MPFMFGLALFFFFLAFIALIAVIFSHEKMPAIGGLVAAVVVGVACTLISSFNTVPIRNVGIVTSYNKPTGEVTGSGAVWVAPWEKVKDWDAGIQTSDKTGGGFTDQNNTGCTGSTLVRIASLATSCVENKIRWKVWQDAAPQQYNDYKGDFNNFVVNYFETERQNALNEIFSSYNPLATLAPVKDKDGNLVPPKVTFDLATKQDELKTALNKRVCPGGLTTDNKPIDPAKCQIIVESISIPLIHHDSKTEANIKATQDLLAKNRNLDQEKLNADKQNTITRSKASTSLEQQCLDYSREQHFAPGMCLQPGWGAGVTAAK